MTRNIGEHTGIEEKQVTIRMLSVDGRNMTKAFFYQLPEYSIGVIRGVSHEDIMDRWGYVIIVENHGYSQYTKYWLVGTVNGKLSRRRRDDKPEDLEQLFIGA